MNTDAPQIQEIIKQLCAAEGSQSKFARRIGATPQKVNNWISGRNEPGADMLFAISRIYEIPMEQLLGATNLDVSFALSNDKIEKETSEMSCYLKRMTDKQRRAVLGVARAMVE